MKVARASEGRGGTRRPAILFSLIAMVVIGGMAVTYYTQGFGSLSAKSEAVETSELVSQPASAPAPSSLSSVQAASPAEVPAPAPIAEPTRRPTSVPAPTATPEPTPTGVPMPVAEVPATTGAESEPPVEPATELPLDFLPEVDFGEVLSEGLVELKLPSGDLVETWYTFRVDTESRDITVYFALIDRKIQSVLSTVRINNYTRGQDLESAEVTLYYQNGSERVLNFNGAEGEMTLTQHYSVPYGPSMFSANLRRAMVWYGMKLQAESSDATVELHLDVSGLSASEEMVFKQAVPSAVDSALRELKVLVDQIEDERLR